MKANLVMYYKFMYGPHTRFYRRNDDLFKGNINPDSKAHGASRACNACDMRLSNRPSVV